MCSYYGIIFTYNNGLSICTKIFYPGYYDWIVEGLEVSLNAGLRIGLALILTSTNKRNQTIMYLIKYK